MSATEAVAVAPFVLRPAESGDTALVLDSWMRSYWRGGNAPKVRSEVFYAGHRGVIEELLKRCAVVACVNPDEPSQVFGWCCSERNGRVAVVHYLFVKRNFERLGFGTALVAAARGDCQWLQHSHRTQDGTRFMEKLGSTWNPYTAGVIR